MKKLIALFGLSLAIVACAAAPRDQEEPRYNGKPLSAWAAQLKHKDIQARTAAANALGQMGPQAKAAYGDLSLALKERTWELWLDYVKSLDAGNAGANHAQKTIEAVSDAIQAAGDSKKTAPEQEIAKLKGQVANLESKLSLQYKQLVDDECLRSIAMAMIKIDEQQTMNMFGVQKKVVTTFDSVGPAIGPAIDDKGPAKK
jgi:hypothetical protein